MTCCNDDYEVKIPFFALLRKGSTMKFQTFVQNLSAFALRPFSGTLYLYPPTPFGCCLRYMHSYFLEKDLDSAWGIKVTILLVPAQTCLGYEQVILYGYIRITWLILLPFCLPSAFN